MRKEEIESLLGKITRVSLDAKSLKRTLREEPDMFEKAATIELMARSLASMIRKKFYNQ